jgi:hypothetical protein
MPEAGAYRPCEGFVGNVDEAPLRAFSRLVEGEQDLHLVFIWVRVPTFVLQAAQVRCVVFEGIRNRGEDLVLDQHRVRVRLDEEVYPVTRPRKDFALNGDIPSQTFFDTFDSDRARQGVEEEATQTVRAFRVEEEG